MSSSTQSADLPPPLELEQHGSNTLLHLRTRRSDAVDERDGTGGSSSLRCLVALLGVASLLLIGLLFSGQPMNRSPPTTCTGGWPAFSSRTELEASSWSAYLEAVYGTMPPTRPASPLCIGDLWVLYSELLDRVLDAESGLPEASPVSECPREEGNLEGVRYTRHSRLTNPNHTSWIWHPRPHGFTALGADTWVEVAHKGGIEDETDGAWFLAAKGSGIWINTGATIAFDDHADGWRHFNVSNVSWGERNQAMVRQALDAGLDSIQFLRHTCQMMYRDCLNTSLPNLTFFNLEVVSTRLVGIFACASANGTSPLLRTGWPPHADRPCTCNNSASEHLHCREVPASLWPAA
jgi:hypothetical protein